MRKNNMKKMFSMKPVNIKPVKINSPFSLKPKAKAKKQPSLFKSPKNYPLNVQHWNKKKPKSKKQMSYPQLRLKIKMNPFGDKDRDKVPNFLDCRPMNKRLQAVKKPTFNQRLRKAGLNPTQIKEIRKRARDIQKETGKNLDKIRIPVEVISQMVGAKGKVRTNLKGVFAVIKDANPPVVKKTRLGIGKKERKIVRKQDPIDILESKSKMKGGKTYKKGTETPKTKAGNERQVKAKWVKQEDISSVYRGSGGSIAQNRSIFPDKQAKKNAVGVKTTRMKKSEKEGLTAAEKRGDARNVGARVREELYNQEWKPQGYTYNEFIEAQKTPEKRPPMKIVKSDEGYAKFQLADAQQRLMRLNADIKKNKGRKKTKEEKKIIEMWKEDAKRTKRQITELKDLVGKGKKQTIESIDSEGNIIQTEFKESVKVGKKPAYTSENYIAPSGTPPKKPGLGGGDDDKPKKPKKPKKSKAPASITNGGVKLTPEIIEERQRVRDFELEKQRGRLTEISARAEREEAQAKLRLDSARKKERVAELELETAKERTRATRLRKGVVSSWNLTPLDETPVEIIDPRLEKPVRTIKERPSIIRRTVEKLSPKRLATKLKEEITGTAPRIVSAKVKEDVVVGSKPVYATREYILEGQTDEGETVTSKVLRKKEVVGEEAVTKKVEVSRRMDLSKKEIAEAQKYGQTEIKKSIVDEQGNVQQVTYKVPKKKSSQKSLKRLQRERGKRRKIRSTVTKTAGMFLPVVTTQVQTSADSPSKLRKSKRRVGRPRGPSGKYSIPGVGPVGVYEYRKWKSKQLALERMRGKPEEEREYYEQEPDMREYYDDQERREYYNQYPEEEEITLPPDPSQTPPQTSLEEEYITEEEMARRRIQQMTNTGRRNVLQTPEKENILNAPNVQRGELRNVGTNSSMVNVDDLNRPITNPDGDYYTEIDPITGKQILRRRVREKWLS